jgi:hypothetical protein
MEPAISLTGQTISFVVSRRRELLEHRSTSMWTSRIEKLLMWSTIWLAGAIALIVAGCTNSDAGARKAALMKASTAQQQKPIKLRYYGGPKYPMYPE